MWLKFRCAASNFGDRNNPMLDAGSWMPDASEKPIFIQYPETSNQYRSASGKR
jgi:hypothetical protein